MRRNLLLMLAMMLCLLPVGLAQETRSLLFGRVLERSAGAVVGAQVTIRHIDTNVSLTMRTNAQGYYEAPLLLPGNYEVSAEMTGFKKTVRRGVVLPVSSRLEVSVTLEIGGVAETVSVTAEAPLLETTAVNAGRII